MSFVQNGRDLGIAYEQLTTTDMLVACSFDCCKWREDKALTLNMKEIEISSSEH